MFQQAKLEMNWSVTGDVSDEKFKTSVYDASKATALLPLQRIGPLLPDSAFSEVLETLHGRRWAFFQIPGNVGDLMIEEGTRQLLARNGISMTKYSGVIPAWAEGLLLSGGGNVGGTWWNCDSVRKSHFDEAQKRKLPIVILPQSIYKPKDIPNEAVVFSRETESLKHYPSARLAPDMAFALTCKIQLCNPVRNKGIFLRSDRESILGSPFGTDPATKVSGWVEYIRLASENEEVLTDRLHFAIGAILSRRKVTLVKNVYHKNQSMWKTWLKHMGCLFSTEV
jgi:exopolysaccharide biosynthesis predicted pyruvyltransferase EpsI